MSTEERTVQERLRYAMATAANDDMSTPMTDKRFRHSARIEAMSDADAEITRLSSALAAAEAKCAEETAIVDRIWDLFGRPSYEELKGRSIYDLIKELQSTIAAHEATIAGLREALNEPFSAGTRVINCVVHTGAFTERPRNCENCATDIRNQLAFAIRVNEFLNNKVDAAKKALASTPTPAQASAMVDVVKAVNDLLDAWPVDDSGVPVIEPEALVDAIGVEVVALVKAHRALSHAKAEKE